MKKFLAIIALAALAIAATAQSNNVVLYTPAVDTITNTESDTITYSFPYRNFDYAWMLQATGISGTDSLSVKIEETACASCSTWKQVGNTATLGATGATNQIAFFTGDLYGLRHRIIITGIGTQSTKYNVYATFRRQD